MSAVSSARLYRSLPRWLAVDYLCAIGGQAQDDNHIAGAGWHAVVSDADDVCIGAARVGQIQIVFAGDEVQVQRVIAGFEKKALRAGG